MLNLLPLVRRRTTPGLFALLGTILFATIASAAEPLAMSAGLELSGSYRTDSWQGVHLEFRNDNSTAIEGSALVPLSDPHAPAAMALPVTVPPNSLVRATVWGYFPKPTAALQKSHKGEVPPLAITEFRGRDGAQLARAELVGVPISTGKAKDGVDDAERGELLLVLGERPPAVADLYEPTWLVAELSEDVGVPMTVADVPADRFPREVVGLRAVKAIVLDNFDPQSLDLAQRAALLEYVRGGA